MHACIYGPWKYLLILTRAPMLPPMLRKQQGSVSLQSAARAAPRCGHVICHYMASRFHSCGCRDGPHGGQVQTPCALPKALYCRETAPVRELQKPEPDENRRVAEY